jgi:nitrogen fixation/metabolism regulation signal transduction histidine kinase
MPLLRARLDDAFWYSIALGAVALVAALFVALALASVTLKPIRRLAEDMERLRRGEFDVGSSAGPRDEFGKLASCGCSAADGVDRTQILAERSDIRRPCGRGSSRTASCSPPPTAGSC